MINKEELLNFLEKLRVESLITQQKLPTNDNLGFSPSACRDCPDFEYGKRETIDKIIERFNLK